jgi:hypothetical protein
MRQNSVIRVLDKGVSCRRRRFDCWQWRCRFRRIWLGHFGWPRAGVGASHCRWDRPRMGQATLVGTGHTGFPWQEPVSFRCERSPPICIFLMYLHAVVNAASCSPNSLRGEQGMESWQRSVAFSLHGHAYLVRFSIYGLYGIAVVCLPISKTTASSGKRGSWRYVLVIGS